MLKLKYQCLLLGHCFQTNVSKWWKSHENARREPVFAPIYTGRLISQLRSVQQVWSVERRALLQLVSLSDKWSSMIKHTYLHGLKLPFDRNADTLRAVCMLGTGKKTANGTCWLPTETNNTLEFRESECSEATVKDLEIKMGINSILVILFPSCALKMCPLEMFKIKRIGCFFLGSHALFETLWSLKSVTFLHIKQGNSKKLINWLSFKGPVRKHVADNVNVKFCFSKVPLDLTFLL